MALLAQMLPAFLDFNNEAKTLVVRADKASDGAMP